MVKLSPVHPGEILKEEFIRPMGITNNSLAVSLNVPASRIDQILKQKRAISADTALRLSIFFGTTAAFWLNLQMNYDLELTKQTSLPDIKKRVRKYQPTNAERAHK